MSSATPAIASRNSDRTPETSVDELVDAARRFLRHTGPLEASETSEDTLVKLASDLKQLSKFTYARRVLFKLRKDYPHLREALRQEHALCTYKDKDVPADRRFDRALRILAGQENDPNAEIDVDRLMTSNSIETLGQVASIYRRLWERDLDSHHLHLSYDFYRKGYERALNDPVAEGVNLAWTGINAAFVLELMARDERAHQKSSLVSMVDVPAEQSHSASAAKNTSQDNRFRRAASSVSPDGDPKSEPVESNRYRMSLHDAARTIRQQLIENLEPTIETRWHEFSAEQERRKPIKAGVSSSDSDLDAKTSDLWWLMSTLGEAYFGNGAPGSIEWDHATKWFQRAGRIPGVQQWHLETTTRRIVQLAQMQVEEERFRDLLPAEGLKDGTHTSRRHRPSSQAERFTHSIWGQVLLPFLGPGHAEAVASAFRGKVGLALSGGGFRASLFHLGVLARLAELDVLRHVEAISCVSGGSILGACYYLKLRRLLQARSDVELTNLGRDVYVELVRELTDEFLAGVQKNIRTRLLTNLWYNMKMVAVPGYTRTERAADLFERYLFQSVDHLTGDDDSEAKRPSYGFWQRPKWRLQELNVEPAASSDDPVGSKEFHPRYHNWLRANKVPMFIVNASTLNTGHNWQFTAQWMGEPPGRISNEVDANDRLRRLYIKEAPDPYKEVRLGLAVAASACVPGLFEPIAFNKLYEGKHIVRLVDGGVYDNQGIGALLEEDCSVILISDASGQMTSQTDPSDGMLGVPLRSNTILMERVRQAQFSELEARRRAGLLSELMFIHLTKDLEMTHVDWRGCPEPADPSYDRPEPENPGRTAYGINADLQRALSSTRTDLDSFTEVEAYALMTSGYHMARKYMPKELGMDNPDPVSWCFLDIAPYMEQEQPNESLLLHLETGTHRFFRPLRYLNERLGGWLKTASVIVVVSAMIIFGVWVLLPSRDLIPQQIPVTVPQILVGLWIALIVAMVLAAWPRFRRWFPAFLTRIVLATAGWVGAWLHLLITDPLYRRIGSMRGLKRRES